jgi:hypothetical protein
MELGRKIATLPTKLIYPLDVTDSEGTEFRYTGEFAFLKWEGKRIICTISLKKMQRRKTRWFWQSEWFRAWYVEYPKGFITESDGRGSREGVHHLNEVARQQGIILSVDLLELIFNPLEHRAAIAYRHALQREQRLQTQTA